uniref:Sema domain-containing protein n=1 Tax=Tetranychus urticae TaxID=32264 RepID=A0A158P4T5_TETUR
MFIQHIIKILELFLCINYLHSFKRAPRHNVLSYYKTMNNVYLADPYNHNTTYRIYVAGVTITIDIPASVAKTSDIVNWKVINFDKAELMFVHNNIPQILINQKTIKNMKYSDTNPLTGSIIALGDNEALHVPTIINPQFDSQNSVWNYLELLRFDAKNMLVETIEKLPWLFADDWKYVSEWKMTDYFHHEDKLYLLIVRALKDEFILGGIKREISIIRLCLNKGSRLISTATEIHYTRPLFINLRIGEVLFDLDAKTLPNEIMLLVQIISPKNDFFYYRRHYIKSFSQLFDTSGMECSKNDATMTSNRLRWHLRSRRKCDRFSYSPCGINNKYYITAYDIINIVIDDYTGFENNKSSNILYPINISLLYYLHTFDQSKSLVCYKYMGLTCELIFDPQTFKPENDWGERFFLNQRPLLSFIVAKGSEEISRSPLVYKCHNIKNCKDCIMFGLFFDCIWSNSACIYDNQTKNKNIVALNKCFRIVDFSPSIFNSSSSNILKVTLDDLPAINKAEEIIIKAGPNNYCPIIKIDKKVISCIMDISESGKFQIEAHVVNDAFADVSVVSAVSINMAHIIASDNKTTIVIIILTVVINACLLLVYIAYKKGQFKRMTQFVESKRSTELVDKRKAPKRFVKSLTLSSQVIRPAKTIKATEPIRANRPAKAMKPKKSSKPNRPPRKLKKSWSSLPSLSKHLYLSKESHPL